MSQSNTLRTRVPGQSAMSAVVRRHKGAVRRSRLARILGASPLSRDNRASYRGALGELLIGDTLDHLGPEWDVLHAVPVGRGAADIDHVVIGPAGVFTIMTKNHTGEEVWVDGQTLLASGNRQYHVRDALFEASHAAALLSAAAERPVAVAGVIVVVNPKRMTVRQQPEGVTVVSSPQLVRWLRRERTLSGTEVAFISDVADRNTTWHSAPTTAEDTQLLHREFAVLRAEVTAAARLRMAWATVAFIVLFATAWTTTAFAVWSIVP